jgi:hypothetical protein
MCNFNILVLLKFPEVSALYNISYHKNIHVLLRALQNDMNH